MPSLSKRRSKLRLEFVADQKATVHGGLPAVEAVCEDFGLWKKLRELRVLDPRTRTTRGYSPELIIAQLLYSFCSGGASLADAEELNAEPLAKLLARVPRFADQTTLGEWLRGQSPEAIAAVWQVIQEFATWVLKHSEAGRWKYCGRTEIFFDDTQLELRGKSFEGAQLNYNGDWALSWQTFWVGPLLVDAELGSPGDVSSALPPMLERQRCFWKDQPAEFLADSGSSAGRYLQAITGAGLGQWSLSYNKWTQPLERIAQEQPESVWGAPQAARWRDGSDITEQHCFIRHQPEGCERALTFAVVRFKGAEEFFWRYRFVVCEGYRSGGAASVFARHQLKGEKEQLLKEVLRGLDLHHPPCAELNANRMFYAIAALAYNVLTAIKLLHLPDECQSWQVKTMLRQLILLPARLVQHARMLVAQIQVPPHWLCWWQRLMQRLWPKPQPGRAA